MAYEVIITNRAQEQADAFIDYLVNVKKNPQAALNLFQDIDDTKESLSLIAGALGYCSDPDLKSRKYKIMFFRHMRYLWIFRIENNRVEIMAMYHQLQDYENLFKAESGHFSIDT